MDRKGVVVRLRLFLMAIAAVVSTACGGADDSVSSTRSVASSSAADTVSETSAATRNDVGPTLAPNTTLVPNTTIAPGTTDFVDINDSEPWRVSLTDPTGPLLDDWVDWRAIAPEPTDPPDGLDAQLTWIYENLIELWRDDVRLPAIGMSDVALDRPNREAFPSSVIDILGSAASMLGDSYAIIAATSELAARPGTPGEPLFATWSEYARRSATAAETIRAAMSEARQMELTDQVCFLAVFDGDDGCDGPGAEYATTVTDDLDVANRAIDDVDLEDLGTYAAFGLEFDECAAWDAAAASTGLTSADQLRIWLALDGNYLDVYFASLSECAWEQDGTEDPAADQVADLAALRAYLVAVADAIVESGYEVGVAEMADGAEDERRYYEYTSADATGYIVTAARDSASETWSTVFTPLLATKFYLVADVAIDDWIQLGDIDVGWDELATTVCDEWTAVVADYPPDQLAVITASVDDLGLDGSLIPKACE